MDFEKVFKETVGPYRWSIVYWLPEHDAIQAELRGAAHRYYSEGERIDKIYPTHVCVNQTIKQLSGPGEANHPFNEIGEALRELNQLKERLCGLGFSIELIRSVTEPVDIHLSIAPERQDGCFETLDRALEMARKEQRTKDMKLLKKARELRREAKSDHPDPSAMRELAGQLEERAYQAKLYKTRAKIPRHEI